MVSILGIPYIEREETENIERALGEKENPLTHSTVCAFDKNSCYENIKIE